MVKKKTSADYFFNDSMFSVLFGQSTLPKPAKVLLSVFLIVVGVLVFLLLISAQVPQ